MRNAARAEEAEDDVDAGTAGADALGLLHGPLDHALVVPHDVDVADDVGHGDALLQQIINLFQNARGIDLVKIDAGIFHVLCRHAQALSNCRRSDW